MPNVGRNDYLDEVIPREISDLPHDLEEGDIIETVGWLHIIAREPDGDYHIQISGSRDDGDNNLIIEVPCPRVSYVSSAGLRTRSATVRKFLRDRTLKGKEPGHAGNVMQHPPCVYVRGFGWPRISTRITHRGVNAGGSGRPLTLVVETSLSGLSTSLLEISVVRGTLW